MGSTDQIEIVFPEKGCYDVGAEREGNSPLVLTPPLDITTRIRPQEITEQPTCRDIGRPPQAPDLVQAPEIGGEPAVHTEYLIVDEGSHGKAVEAVGEYLPQPDVVPALALVVEPVDPVHGFALVVAPEKEEVAWVLDLVCEQEAYRLEAVLSPVDVVSEEQVVGARREAAIFEQP